MQIEHVIVKICAKPKKGYNDACVHVDSLVNIYFFILHFDGIHMRNSHYSPVAIVLKYTIFSCLPPSNWKFLHGYLDC